MYCGILCLLGDQLIRLHCQ